MYDALKAHFKSKKKKAIANLTIYLQSPVGVGEHSDIVNEMVKLTKKIADAQGCIESLENTFEVSDESHETEIHKNTND